MRKLFLFTFISLSGILFLSCKKGEDDPLISVLSRKSRVSGEWKLEKAEISIGIKDSTGAYSAYVYKLAGSNYEFINTGKGATFRGKSSLTASFSRNGVFTFKQVLDSVSLTSIGFWDFQGHVGKAKNKEYITFHLETIDGNSGKLQMFNKTTVDFIYKIKELRNKKMVLICEEEPVVMKKGYSFYITSEYTFVQ